MKIFSFTRFGAGGIEIYDVTVDIKRFLIVEAAGSEETSSPVTLVVNWMGQVKEK